jgi:hypothetical protein
MKRAVAILGILLGCCSFAHAQSSGGSTSSGSTIRGTAGTPGSNASNARNHGTTGNNLGATQTNPGAGPSSGNAIDTPVAKAAEENLESTNTGILKK